MASTSTSGASTSAASSKLAYDVFLNHRGPDVKHTLALPIYHALSSIGLRVFLDSEELELGESVPAAIEAAMGTASLHIPIFSPNYAQSPWCLAELSFILKTGMRIIPIFYHVQPSDLRWVAQGKGIYVEAFSDHEKKGRYTTQKLEEWKMALHSVSFYTGEIINNNDHEGMVLKNIVNRVLKVMKKVTLEVAKHPVGLTEAVQDFERTTLQSAQTSDHKVQIVGIWGMAGSGKTTLAKELYNQKCLSMGASSFLFDVRDAAAKNRLHKKQKKLLEDLGVKGVSIDNVEEGKWILSSRLRSVRVLVVLDDVDHVDQLDALLPTKDGLGWGSLIIVTTREREVLRSWGISSFYKMQTLNPLHAKQLFCWHAFLQPSPLSGFEDLVEKFVNACNGLPLSLKVFGSQLYGESSKDYWEGLFKKISNILPKDIKERLKVSYDDLDEEEQEVFLDTACFFIGEKKSLAIAAWEGSGWSGLHCWERLVSKGLFDLDQQGRIRMQRNLHDLGREIAITHTPCRLWSHLHMATIQIHAKETMRIRGIMAATTQFDACSAHDEFPSCSSQYQPPFEECMKLMANSISRSSPARPFSLGLNLLVVTGEYFNQKYSKLSGDLVWLRWFDFKHPNLPSWLSLQNLRILELYDATSLRELWEDSAPPPFSQLREMAITCTWGSSLEKFPSSISHLKHLKKIALIGYLGEEFRIKRLPEEICLLQSLEHLELRHCRVLSSLPTRFGELKNLRHIDLSSCVELRMLPVSFKQLMHLEYLNLSGCRKLTFRLDFLENISKLKELNFSECRRLQELPHGITNQGFLRQLNMPDTRLRNMPSKIGQLSKLETLRIGSPSLRSLPVSLGDLSSLTRLIIFDCPNLEFIPESVGFLKHLEYLCIESSGVKSLPKSLRQLATLQTLEISGCPIKELDFGEGYSLPSCMYMLKLLHVADTQVFNISISEGCCPSLEALQVRQNDYLVEIGTLPTSLKMIELWECERLKDITGIRVLQNLKKLEISGCSQLDVQN